MKDDSGSYAVFTAQGSSASQITAAKVLDVIARLLGCAGQESDAVSSNTQVKMEDAPYLLKLPKSECPDIWTRLPRYRKTGGWQNIEEPVMPLVRNLYGHPLANLTVREDFTANWMRESANLRLSVRPSPTRDKDYVHLYTWTTSNGREEASFGANVENVLGRRRLHKMTPDKPKRTI